SQRGGRRPDRALARAGGRRRHGRQPPPDGLRVRGVGYRRGRCRRHVGDRRHLPQGVRHRTHRNRGEERPVVRPHSGDAGGGFLLARTSARGDDAGRGARAGRDARVRVAGIALAIGLAVALQTTLARFVMRGTVAVDLVLVAVVYVALTSGPVTGLLT